MKVYVAGRTSAIERVRDVQKIFRDNGWEIAFDWTRTEEEGGEGGIAVDWSHDPIRARTIAEKERDACFSADLVVLLWDDGGLGMLLETGIAMGARTDIWVVGCPRDSIFFYLDGVWRFDSDLDLPNAVEAVSQKQVKA